MREDSWKNFYERTLPFDLTFFVFSRMRIVQLVQAINFDAFLFHEMFFSEREREFYR